MLSKTKEGVVVLSLQERRTISPFSEWSPLWFPVRELAIFTREFAQLLHSGFSPHQAIQMLSETVSHPRLRRVLCSLREKLALSGEPMVKLLARHRDVFPPLYSAIVEAGEESGNLERVLFDLADFYDKEFEWRRTLLSRMAYPVAIFLIWFIVLPILGMLGFHFPWLNILGYLILLGIIAYFFLSRTRYIHPVIHFFGLIVPGLGRLYRSLSLSRYFRILSLQVEAGVPIMDALERAAHCSADWRIQQAGRRMVQQVEQGNTLEDAFRSSRFFSQQDIGMVAVGEVAGDPGQMMQKLANYHRLQAETLAHTLLSTLPVFVQIFIGVMVGITVISFWGQYFSRIFSAVGE